MRRASLTPDLDSERQPNIPSNPIPVSKWRAVGNVWPTEHGWYNMLRPENLRYELVNAGVARFVNGRWLIFPDKWQLYVAENHRPRIS